MDTDIVPVVTIEIFINLDGNGQRFSQCKYTFHDLPCSWINNG